MRGISENKPGSFKVFVLDVLWREKSEKDSTAILGGLQLHQRVLDYLNKQTLTIGLSSHPPIFKHKITYCVKQGFGKPLRLEFYKYLVKLLITFLKITSIHKPHIVYNPGVSWHNEWLAFFAKLLGLKVASYFHHYSLPGGGVVYPRNIFDLPMFNKMCIEIKKISRIPHLKLLDYLVLFQQLKIADIVFTGTGFGLDQLKKIGRRKPVVLTGIGIDLEEFRKDPPGEENKIWDGLFVGRMAPEKGIYDLLSIWRKVVDKIPTAKLAVVGKVVRPYFDKWVEVLRKLKIEGNVSHLGELSRKELIKAYYSSRVFVFPSRIEGAGIVIAEAMAAGLPVVARNLPAYKTLYLGAPALYLVDDEEGFSTKIVELLTTTVENRLTMGLRNREYVMEKFSWESVSQKILRGITEYIKI